MRALLDANVYISYLLTREKVTPPVMVIAAAFRHTFVLLLTERVIAEVIEKTQTKPYLANRISQSETRDLIEELRMVAELIPELDPPLPEVGPDRKDDYLFAHALAGRADYLVSGNFGVQDIGRIGDVRIVGPAEFVNILEAAG